jgi:hypothetical protein
MALSEQISSSHQFHTYFAAKILGNVLPLASFSLPTRFRRHLSTSYAQLLVRFGFFVEI